jgi:hypothetical protein
MNVLLDELRAPPLRLVIGSLLRAAARADLAVAHVRLAAIDLAADEMSSLVHCRMLLGRLDAQELARLDTPAQRARRHLETLHRFLTSGRVEIRSAGIGAWSPDFSIYTGLGDGDAGPRAACIVGAHYFHQPLVDGGPSFTCVLTEAAAVRLAQARFARLWDGAHDVHPAVVGAIEHILHGPA